MAGLSWDRIKTNAMQLVAPFDHIKIDLTDPEQTSIKECVQKQEAFDAANQKPDKKLNDTRILGCLWKNVRDLIMDG